MKYITHLFILILFLTSQSYAKHIVGGDVTVKYLSSNANDTSSTFKITIQFFRDCSLGNAPFDPYLYVGIFSNGGSPPYSLSITAPLKDSSNIVIGDACYDPNICMQKAVYEYTVTLTNRNAGYYISTHRCCRSAVITNIVDPENSGYIMYCEIPNPLLHNSSPTFNSIPDGYMCRTYPNADDFSATDTDGDSLVYSFIDPLSCSAPTTGGPICSGTGTPISVPTKGTIIPGAHPKPYGNVDWQSPYNVNNTMGDVTQKITPAGVVTITPPDAGVFVFCVRVEEYRNKVKIGEIRRDFQFKTMPCHVFHISSSSSTTICKGETVTLSAAAPGNGFNYSWAPGGETTSAVSVSPTTTTAYSVTITNGACVQKAFTTVYVHNNLLYTSAVKDILCKGEKGNASVTPSSGIPPYSYLWTTAPAQTTSMVSGLIAGTYSCQITDSYGCSAVGVITVNQLPPIVINGSVIDASTCTSNDGAINITLSGGTSPYTYSWSNNSTTASISGLAQGIYTLFLKDANGCSDTLKAEVKCITTDVYEYRDNGAFMVYPNLTTGTFFIKFDLLNMNNCELMIYNVLGKRVLYRKGISKLYEVDISPQPEGIYFVQVRKDRNIYTQKVIVKK